MGGKGELERKHFRFHQVSVSNKDKCAFFGTLWGRWEHRIGVGRVEHERSGKGARLALVTMWVRRVWVTLGVTPWACCCCARYVRYTRTGFPPQTRHPSRSSRSLNPTKGRNSGGVRVRISLRVGETGCRYHWSRCGTGAGLGGLKRAGVGAGAPPARSSHSPPLDLVSIPIRHHLISMSVLTAAAAARRAVRPRSCA